MLIARNDMPMQMRSQVTEAGEIDFVRPHHFAYHCFDSKYDCHQMYSFGSGKISHFLDVQLPDYSTETRIVGILDPHHAASFILPEQCTAHLIAQFTNRFAFQYPPFIGRRDSSNALTATHAQSHRYSPWPHSPATSFRRADAWPFPPQCNPPWFRYRRCSVTNPAGRMGRKSVS
jgi:hypothetical protein